MSVVRTVVSMMVVAVLAKKVVAVDSRPHIFLMLAGEVHIVGYTHCSASSPTWWFTDWTVR